MLVIEVNNGFCRAPFECEFVPRASFSSYFVDVSRADPKPGEFWRYNYATGEFVPPPLGADGRIDYAAAHMQEAKWNDVRNHRNVLLMESDWTQLKDSPLSLAARVEWARYRRVLRELPQKHVGNPLFVQFPPRPDRIARPTYAEVIRRVFKIFFGGAV